MRGGGANGYSAGLMIPSLPSIRRPKPHRRSAPFAVRPAIRRCTAGRTLALFVASLALASCGGKGAGGGGFQMPPTPVEVSRVEPQTVRDQFHALGSIESDENVQIVSELSAIVVALPFTEGQSVEKNALLARLDDREFRAAAQRDAAELDRARLAYDRAVKLSEQKVISAQDLDDAQATLKIAEANVALSRARLDKTRIRAPFGGLVGRRRVSPGAYLSTGDVITELARVDEMKVTLSMPERYLGQLHPGLPVTIMTPAYPNESFAGRLSVVDPIVDPQTRTVQLVARIPNVGRRLRPGLSADVSVTFAERTRALVVPDEAVFAEGNRSFVYVVKTDSSVTRTAIDLGSRDSSHVEVLRGLERGALVVRAGHQKLFEGAKVMPVSSAGGHAAGPSGKAAAEARK